MAEIQNYRCKKKNKELDEGKGAGLGKKGDERSDERREER